jgi:hypothetical protein
MDARRELSVRLAAKSTTVAVVAGGLLGLGPAEPPRAPHHADIHRQLVGLPPYFGIAGGTAMRPEAILERNQPLASASPGPSQHFKPSSGRFAGVSILPDPPRHNEEML